VHGRTDGRTDGLHAGDSTPLKHQTRVVVNRFRVAGPNSGDISADYQDARLRTRMCCLQELAVSIRNAPAIRSDGAAAPHAYMCHIDSFHHAAYNNAQRTLESGRMPTLQRHRVRQRPTRSPTIAEGPRDALLQSKLCQLLHNCTKNRTYTTLHL